MISNSIKPVLCIGLNPAFQKVYHFKNYTTGSVNRAYEVTESASGKGINVVRVLHTLSKPAIVTGFLGGDTGQFIKEFLKEEGLEHRFIQIRNKTRTCTTIIVDGDSTAPSELVEEGRLVSEQEVAQFVDMLDDLLKGCGLVTISGTAPIGISSDIYLRIMQKADKIGVPVILDTQKDYLWQALKARALFVKPNLQELGAALETELDSDEKIWQAIDRIHETGAGCVLISNEDKPSYLSIEGKRYKLQPPEIKPVNAIGCGDSVTAGIAAALLDRKSYLDAAIYGTACGSASALTSLPGFLNPDDLAGLIDRIEVSGR